MSPETLTNPEKNDHDGAVDVAAFQREIIDTDGGQIPTGGSGRRAAAADSAAHRHPQPFSQQQGELERVSCALT
jgi:hypothetical protein